MLTRAPERALPGGGSPRRACANRDSTDDGRGKDRSRAARVFGAAEALREANDLARPPLAQPGYDADVAVARAALGADRFQAAHTAGRSLSVETAVAALSRRRGSRTERQVARLAVEGMSNADMAATLFVTVHTVKAHLTKVFTKLEVTHAQN